MKNELRQGYVIAPTLFNLSIWCLGSGERNVLSLELTSYISVVGSYVEKGAEDLVVLEYPSCKFADDLAAVGTSRESMEGAARILDDLLKE